MSRTTVIFIFSLCYCFCNIDGFGMNMWKIKKMVVEHQQKQYFTKHMKQHSQSLPVDSVESELEYKYITQFLDQFDPQNQATYSQRYSVNDDYWRKPDGPVFLYIGGEGAMSPYVVQGGAYVEFAKKYGALIFAVEHRFYGGSINPDGLELNNLRYLSSQQALADLAWFHKNMSETYRLTEANKWISFGGSYPGALSAWFRVKYPHLVHASVASSAPVEAKVDFIGYNDVVAQSLGSPIVRGSMKCVAAVKEAFQTIDSMLAGGRRQQLEQDFLSCEPLLSELDIFTFVSNIADIFMGTVQYNNEGPFSIETICEVMSSSGSPYQNLVDLHKKFFMAPWANCSDYSWQSFLLAIKNTTVDPESSMMRQWIYQTCSQFGYYQTCDVNTSCPFSRHMSLDPNLGICQLVFNISKDSVSRSVDFTNAYYGSNNPRGSRILFVNGLIDPWHALSVLDNISSSDELVVLIPSTAHCADMLSDKPTDPPALRAARQTISEQIGIWLGQPAVDVAPKPEKKTPQSSGNLFNVAQRFLGRRQRL